MPVCAHISVPASVCLYSTVSLGLSVSLSTCVSDYGMCTCGPGSTCLMLTPQVTQHIATCQPLTGALDNGRVILCDMMADPWVSAPSSSGLMVIEAPMGGVCEQGMRQGEAGPLPLRPLPSPSPQL